MKTLLEPVERNGLADLLLELGPEAPTLCAGWRTRDLATHLVLIQRRWDSWAGGYLAEIGVLRRFFDGLAERERSRPWPELVARVRAGAKHGHFAIQRFRDKTFLRESLIHFEDVRRANGLGSRQDVAALQEKVWGMLPHFKFLVKLHKPYGLEVVHPDGRRQTIRRGERGPQLVGEPIDLLLYLFGRTAAAQVTVVDPSHALRLKDSTKLVSLPRASVLEAGRKQKVS